MKYELWKNLDDDSITLAPVPPEDQKTYDFVTANSVRFAEFEAKDHDEAMVKRNEVMGWPR